MPVALLPPLQFFVEQAYTAVDELADAGVTRMSIGMQSAVPHVLAALDRTHRPENVGQAVAAARAAGLGVSIDLIYGAPGESLSDWSRSVDAAVALEPDHISAYALIIEDGTKLARQIRRGEVPAPDDDLQAAIARRLGTGSPAPATPPSREL